MADTHPGDRMGDRLKLYWTKGEGLAKWADKPHPWTALYNELVKHVNPELAKRLTETYFVAVFGFHSGSRKGKNPVGPG
jgi:hypothetical protein